MSRRAFIKQNDVGYGLPKALVSEVSDCCKKRLADFVLLGERNTYEMGDGDDWAYKAIMLSDDPFFCATWLDCMTAYFCRNGGTGSFICCDEADGWFLLRADSNLLRHYHKLDIPNWAVSFWLTWAIDTISANDAAGYVCTREHFVGRFVSRRALPQTA